MRKNRFINTEKLAALLHRYIIYIRQYFPEKNTVKPFMTWSDTFEEFYNTVKPYKSEMKDFFNTMKHFKKSFSIHFIDKSLHDRLADIDNQQMKIYKDFFKLTKRKRIETLAHELTHLVQFMFPFKDKDWEYYEDPFEVEAMSNDVARDLRRAVRRGKVKNTQEAVKFIKNDNYFKWFNDKDKKRMMRKILNDVYFYNPIKESKKGEKLFVDTGNVPELLYSHISNMNPDVYLFYPFKEVNGLWESFKETMLHYKPQIDGFWGKMRDFKKNFKMEILREINIEEDVARSYVNKDKIVLFQNFFRYEIDEDMISTIDHEFTHMVQNFFAPGRVMNNTYENDKFEIEAVAKEIYRDVKWHINEGIISTSYQAAARIRENWFFRKMQSKEQKRVFRKIMTTLEEKFNGIDKLTSSLKELNELLIPRKKISDETIMYRKMKRQEKIEDVFAMKFFSVIASLGTQPEDFIDRYHKYITEGRKKKRGRESTVIKMNRRHDITISEMMNFIKYADKDVDVIKNVLKITEAKMDVLRNLLETELLDRIKRIMRGTAKDETHAGVSHVIDVKQRYDGMRIRSIKKRWNVLKLLRK